jgi:Transposase DDE domain group 1
MPHSTPTLEFPLLSGKAVHVDFSGGRLSSDGGLMLLAQLDRQIGLTERVTACIKDVRLPGRIQHSLLSLLRQRVYQIAAGYEDCNDANPLRADPALKVAVGRAPTGEPDLASQPTLSRLEQTVSEPECAAINRVLLWHFLACPRKTPREVVLDIDTTDDPTHGQQEFAFFSGHYGTYCYLPHFVFAKVHGESEEFLVSAELPDSHCKDADAILATLARLVGAIRTRWPKVKVVFRADGWFATPAIYDWCEKHGVAYAIGLPSNAVLQEKSRPWRETAAVSAANSPSKKARRFGEFLYQAQGWRTPRRVVVKAEVTPKGPNPRYVVVSELDAEPRLLYHFYGRRGGCENRIKELKEAIQVGRTSCCEFASNKVRLMLHAVAYVLLQRLRRVARGTGAATAQVETLRRSLLKIAALVKESGRRVHVALASACPTQALFGILARRLGVSTG